MKRTTYKRKSFETIYVKRKCTLIKATTKAYLVLFKMNNQEHWIPKSVCVLQINTVLIAPWFYQKKFKY